MLCFQKYFKDTTDKNASYTYTHWCWETESQPKHPKHQIFGSFCYPVDCIIWIYENCGSSTTKILHKNIHLFDGQTRFHAKTGKPMNLQFPCHCPSGGLDCVLADSNRPVHKKWGCRYIPEQNVKAETNRASATAANHSSILRGNAGFFANSHWQPMTINFFADFELRGSPSVTLAGFHSLLYLFLSWFIYMVLYVYKYICVYDVCICVHSCLGALVSKL